VYVVSGLADYLLTYSVVPWSNGSLLDHVEGLMLGLGFAAFAVVGALLISRRPANAVGWIMASTGLIVPVFNGKGDPAARVRFALAAYRRVQEQRQGRVGTRDHLLLFFTALPLFGIL
jgi:hypothetical protein